MIAFDQASHTYTVNGVIIQRSCTSLVNSYFAGFDSQKMVDKYYSRWKAQNDQRYAHHMHLDDDSAKRAIIAEWNATAQTAATRGTLIHKWAEEMLTLHTFRESPELEQIKLFIAEFGLTFFKAEIPTWYMDDGIVVSAGTVDALFKDADDNIILVDWKRSKNPLVTGGFGVGRRPLEHIKDCAFNKYSLQTSIYALMLEHSHALKIHKQVLVRVYPDLVRPEIKECANFRREAAAILCAEKHRL